MLEAEVMEDIVNLSNALDAAHGVAMYQRLDSNSPRRVEAIYAGPVETEDVARRICESCLAPEPRFFARVVAESKTFALEPFDRFIEQGSFEIHDGL